MRGTIPIKNFLTRITKLSFLIFLFSPIYTYSIKSYGSEIDSFNVLETKKILSQINTRIEHLDRLIQQRDSEEACIQSKILIKLISQNLEGLKSIEAQHNWKEISDAILEISEKKCV